MEIEHMLKYKNVKNTQFVLFRKTGTDGLTLKFVNLFLVWLYVCDPLSLKA